MYIQIKNNKLYLCGTFPFEGYTKKVSLDYDEYINNPDKYIFNGNDFVVDPTYPERKREEERQRVLKLKCTKRVLVKILEELGKDYYQDILPLIESNRDAKLQWDLCVELERGNPLINIIGGQLDISEEQIDNIFKYANGEIETLGVS